MRIDRFNIDNHRHLLVRSVMRRQDGDPVLEAVLDAACKGQTLFDLKEWGRLWRGLEVSDLTVGDLVGV